MDTPTLAPDQLELIELETLFNEDLHCELGFDHTLAGVECSHKAVARMCTTRCRHRAALICQNFADKMLSGDHDMLCEGCVVSKNPSPQAIHCWKVTSI